jgi:hypothetical protein
MAGREFKLREESMTIKVGKNMTWHRVSDDRRRTDEIPVKVLKIARNGVFGGSCYLRPGDRASPGSAALPRHTPDMRRPAIRDATRSTSRLRPSVSA